VGVFDVTLTVTNAYGEDSEVKNNFVEVGYVGFGDTPLTAEHVLVYPNPTSGMISVEMNGNFQSVGSLEIFNVLGEKLIGINDPRLFMQTMQFDLGGNPPGIYYLNIKTGDNVIIKKITLSR
jgi:hypothetical protein